MFGMTQGRAQENQIQGPTTARARRGALGNQARLRRIASGQQLALGPRAQTAGPRLIIGAENDPLEHEADRAADRVMHADSASSSAPTLSSGGPTVQRVCEACKTQDEEGDADIDPGAAADTELEGDVASEIQGLQGGGTPLPASQRAFFGARFGQDFSGVRLHDSPQAARLARSVGARAFTLGSDIVLGSGEYSPGTEGGDRLLAHELAHVVQQGRSQPFIQRLAITRTRLTSGTCGQRDVQWKFALSSPAAAPGYIVQHINTSESVKTCPDKAVGPPAPTQQFWEAWPIAAGATVHPRTAALGRTDLSIRPSRPNENGRQQSAGELKFFARSITGDLGDFSVASSDPASAWGPGRVATSGAVPSTAGEPSWWSSTPVEGPVNRIATSQWDCCDSDPAKQTSTVTANP